MIIRHIARRQGRALVRATPSQTRQWPRWYASEVDTTDSQRQLGADAESELFDRIMQSAMNPSGQAQSATDPSDQVQSMPKIDEETATLARSYNVHRHQQATYGRYGGGVRKFYKPDTTIMQPPSPSQLTPELLLASQAHLGHSTSLWNPMNSRYIYGVRDGIHIIALEETLAHLRRACQVVKGVAERGGLILFVGTRKGQQDSIVNAARKAGACHLFEKWTPGSITNGNQILGPCKKKIVDINDKEITISEDSLDAIPALKPDLVICLNPLENWVLLNECALNNIPTIGVIDTDADPTCVTYPIPANDDSLRCTNVIAGALGRAGQEGQQVRKGLASKGLALYEELQLPTSVVLGETYTTTFKEEDVRTEYLEANGEKMSAERIQQIHKEGVVIDDSLMKIYNDNDGGDPYAEVQYRLDDETGQMIPEITAAGGAPVSEDSRAPPGGVPPSMPEITQTPTDEAGLRLGGVEAELADIADQLAMPSATERAIDEELASSLEIGDFIEEKAAQQDEKEARVRDDTTEQLASMMDKDRMEAAEPKPDDKRQAALDEANKKKSH